MEIVYTEYSTPIWYIIIYGSCLLLGVIFAVASMIDYWTEEWDLKKFPDFLKFLSLIIYAAMIAGNLYMLTHGKIEPTHYATVNSDTSFREVVDAYDIVGRKGDLFQLKSRTDI